MLRFVLAVLIFALGATAACSSQPPDHVTAFLGTLDKATYKNCGAQRDSVARYLLTGQPISMDAQYLQERTYILEQPKDVQQAYTREYVNSLTAQCDASELAAIQARQAAEQAARDKVAYQAACLRLGGTLASADSDGFTAAHDNPHIFYVGDPYKAGQCIITYLVAELGQNMTYVLPLASNGAFDPTKYDYNRNVRCKGYPQDFHSDTGVCVVVGFLS